LPKVKNIRREVVMGIVSTGVAKRKTKRRRLVLSCGHLTGWKHITAPVPFLTICDVCTGPRTPPERRVQKRPPGEHVYKMNKADPMNRHKVKGFKHISGQWVYSFKELKAAISLDLDIVGNLYD